MTNDRLADKSYGGVLSINNAAYTTVIGINEKERSLPQPIYVDVHMDISKPVSDRIENTVNYTVVSNMLQEIAMSKEYNLIETLAEDFADSILNRCSVSYVDVTVKKPHASKKADFTSYRIKREVPIAYIGLGSNLGNRHKNLDFAQTVLNQYFPIMDVSSTYETLPEDHSDQRKYLNQVVKVRSRKAPKTMMEIISVIEETLGRPYEERDGSRTIDVDVILYNNQLVQEEIITVPHPRMHTRSFVLAPLLEVEPNAWHPLFNKSAEDLYLSIDDYLDIKLVEHRHGFFAGDIPRPLKLIGQTRETYTGEENEE